MGDFVDQVNYAEHDWDKEYELILVDRGDKAKCMGWLCTHTSNYYNNQRRMLLVPASAVSWFLNVFGMFATYLGKEKISEPLVILIVSLGNFIVATLTTIAEQGKAGDKVELFNQTSRDYNLIASEINHQIRLPPYNRKPVMKVLIDTEKRYNDLIKSTPNIPEPITKDFIKKNQKLPGFEDISKPEGIIELTSCKHNLYKTNDDDKYYYDGVSTHSNISIESAIDNRDIVSTESNIGYKISVLEHDDYDVNHNDNHNHNDNDSIITYIGVNNNNNNNNNDNYSIDTIVFHRGDDTNDI